MIRAASSGEVCRSVGTASDDGVLWIECQLALDAAVLTPLFQHVVRQLNGKDVSILLLNAPSASSGNGPSSSSVTAGVKQSFLLEFDITVEKIFTHPGTTCGRPDRRPEDPSLWL
jgi:hypothetical protein